MKFIQAITCVGILLNINFAYSNMENDSAEVVIHLKSGEKTILEVLPSDTFMDVMLMAEKMFDSDDFIDDDHFQNEKKTFTFDYKNFNKNLIADVNTTPEPPRDYDSKLTLEDKKNITYIVTTLGGATLKKIWNEESALKRAGDKVNRVHPLKFLAYIFSDEKTKVGLIQIKKTGGIIGRKFFNGLYDTLTKEADLKNLKAEHINDFANNLKIDSKKVLKPIEERNWKELINVLIELLPRSGNPNRYDM